MFHPVIPRVLIPDDEWTAFRNEIFDNWFPLLKEKNAAAVFAVLYDLAYHSRTGAVKASLSHLSKLTGLDARTLKKCLLELRELNLIHKSKSHQSGWKVPLAKFELKGAMWTPVPRLLIQYYIPIYHKAVLLLQILRIQSYKWLDYCWARTETLGKKMGWGETRTRYAMMEMSDRKKWRARRTHLPHPLSWRRETHGWLSRVRAVRYEPHAGSKPTVRLTSEFSKRFRV